MNNVIGLMGNNNGDPTDDITYRNGTIEYSKSQRAIYQAAMDCKKKRIFLLSFYFKLSNKQLNLRATID